MNELNQTILQECREQVARENGFTNWQQAYNSVWQVVIRRMQEQAALLAMEKQAEFHFWIMANYHYNPTTETWQDPRDIMGEYDELELYNIWREGK